MPSWAPVSTSKSPSPFVFNTIYDASRITGHARVGGRNPVLPLGLPVGKNEGRSPCTRMRYGAAPGSPFIVSTLVIQLFLLLDIGETYASWGT